MVGYRFVSPCRTPVYFISVFRVPPPEHRRGSGDLGPHDHCLGLAFGAYSVSQSSASPRWIGLGVWYLPVVAGSDRFWREFGQCRAAARPAEEEPLFASSCESPHYPIPRSLICGGLKRDEIFVHCAEPPGGGQGTQGPRSMDSALVGTIMCTRCLLCRLFLVTSCFTSPNAPARFVSNGWWGASVAAVLNPWRLMMDRA